MIYEIGALNRAASILTKGRQLVSSSVEEHCGAQETKTVQGQSIDYQTQDRTITTEKYADDSTLYKTHYADGSYRVFFEDGNGCDHVEINTGKNLDDCLLDINYVACSSNDINDGIYEKGDSAEAYTLDLSNQPIEIEMDNIRKLLDIGNKVKSQKTEQESFWDRFRFW